MSVSITKYNLKCGFWTEVDMALTTTFVGKKIDFTFPARKIDISNDSTTKYIEYSFDGINVAGRVEKGEAYPIFVFGQEYISNEIYIRGEAGGENYKIWAYGN